MKAKLKSFAPKKPSKDEREKLILIGLVDLYLKTGKPVGSQTLQENGFDSLSPATLRNYFSKLEGLGLLKQQHSSGGRIPTHAAYRIYAESLFPLPPMEEKDKKSLADLFLQETREVHAYLQKCAHALSNLSQGAVFLSLPRFDQDFVLDVKVISLDAHRLLCVFLTDFGNVHPEVLYIDQKLSTFEVKRIEQFFQWKITHLDKPAMGEEEEKRAFSLYNEAMLRHIVSYSNFSSHDLLKSGFSQMLHYPDFNDASSLASGLSLFENHQALQNLLSECFQKKELCFWVGEDLAAFSPQATCCAVIAAPYFIHQTIAGSIAVLCPSRIPYKKLFALVQTVAEMLSLSLTQSLYKFKISYRKPNPAQLDFNQQALLLVESKTPEHEQ